MSQGTPKLLWLRCKASCGQFGNEVAVSGVEYNGEEFSLFADRRFLDCQGGANSDTMSDALLQVVEVARDGDRVLVRLPGRTLANGQTITVRAEALEECGAYQET